MIHAKKVVLLPYEEPSNDLHSIHTPTSVLSRLDNAMCNILNLNDFQDEREKWNKYSQTLQKFINIQKNNNNIEYIQPNVNQTVLEEGEAAKNQTEISDESILQTVPKKFQTKAKLFLDYARQVGNLTWDQNGVVTANGDTIAGSNIVDIVNDAMRNRKIFYASGRRRSTHRQR